ncbi:MAG: type II toxin-antitoxin system HipA family toxin [Spirochaetaceae bacterium]|nr:type II toxin-antitoxin system HipA family toxin [Spirochaetaceae bacterium]
MSKRLKSIFVYAHWKELIKPELMGRLSISEVRGKEIFSFEYNPDWLDSGNNYVLDPDLQFYSGPQYLYDEKLIFGMFMDSSPDRWGRLLIKRREALYARIEKRAEKRLKESDFLLGVYDGGRMGGLRFKTEINGDFLDNNHLYATPPWASIRELESVSLNLERPDADKDLSYRRWLDYLVAPGSSLGGARPKAGVVDSEGNLWIAKFPSRNDLKDSGAWELIVCEMAQRAGLQVSECHAEKYSSKHHTFLTKRFDRNEKGNRIHFASAMTMLGYRDGEDAASGASYLEMAEFLVRNGAEPERDLKELWTRIVFNILVSNTDDHLRNHGFLLTTQGWRLSPAFDINPDADGYGLSLNITENDNRLDVDLALEAAPYYRVGLKEGRAIIENIRSIVREWPAQAEKYNISSSEKERMLPAFIENEF